jgi:hypothetical protein
MQEGGRRMISIDGIEYLDRKAVARLTGRSPDTVRNWALARSPALKPARYLGRVGLYDPFEVERFRQRLEAGERLSA